MKLGLMEIFGDRNRDPSRRVSFLFFAFGVAWAAYVYYTYRQGYIYRGRNEVVYRKNEPKRFVRWVALHALVAGGMIAVSVYSFFTAPD